MIAVLGGNSAMRKREEYCKLANIYVVQSGKRLFRHYMLNGCFEGRNPNRDFNTYEYVLLNPDIIFNNTNPILP